MDLNWMNVAFIDLNMPFKDVLKINEKIEELKNNAKSEFDAFLKDNGLEEKAGIIAKKDRPDEEKASSDVDETQCGGLMEIYSVVGCDDLEGWTFACCTTREKAEKAVERLKEEGFEDKVEIVQEELPLDVIEIGDDLIQL